MQRMIHSTLVMTGLVAILLVAGASEAQAQSTPSSTPCSTRHKLAWEMPLRSSDVGRPVTEVLSRAEFSTVRNLFGDRDRVAIGRAPDGTVALQMNIPKGENRTSTFFLGPFGRKGVDVACLSLRIFLENGFEWAKGGGGTKLGFGLWGGDEASELSGGTPPSQQHGFSVRNVNSSYGFRLYSYHLNRPGDFGQQGGAGLARWGSSDWRPGRWVNVDLEVAMNDLGRNNGYAQLWLNGKYRQTMTGLVFRNKSDWAIRGIHFSDIWGGNTSDPKHFSPKNQRMWYADYKLYASNGTAVSRPTSEPSPEKPGTGAPDVPKSSSMALVAPSGQIAGKSVVLQWTLESQADRYYVKVIDTRDKSTLYGGSAWPSTACKGSDCKLGIGSLPRGEYEWMVRPVVGTKAGDYTRMRFAVL